MPKKNNQNKIMTDSKNIALLKDVFAKFEHNSKKLENAYSKMQKDFKKLNLELDAKNEELTNMLHETGIARERLNSILQSLKNGVILVNVDGVISHFNKAAEMIGLKTKDALGKFYEDIIPYAKESKGIMHTLKTKIDIKYEEREITLKDGSRLPVRYSASLVKDDKGVVTGALEVFQDISDIKNMQQEIQQTRTLAALGEMSATVAHEIRNPLGGIGTYAALLERDLDIKDPRRKLVKNILSGITSLNKIVTNLLVYTRPMLGGLKKIPLNDIVKEIGDFALLEIQNKHGKNIKLKYQIPQRALYSSIDPEKIQQLLLNLFFNSADAIKHKGEIILYIKQTSKQLAKDSYSGVKKWNCIGIKDTGVGIPKEKMEKIFNPFFTTKEDGTGLGLAIVRKIAEFHNGYIFAKSQIGKGTAFELYLPAV